MRDEFRRYMEEAIGRDNAAVAFSAFGQPASTSVRLNRTKLDGRLSDSARVGEYFRCGVAPVAWSREGYRLEQRPDFTLDPLFHGGAYYVQDSSAMFVGEIFRRVAALLDADSGVSMASSGGGRAGVVRVLDLCAAPGGKTTDLAASLRMMFGGEFLLVANEVMSDRVGVLSENVAKWGDPNVLVTRADSEVFAALKGFFDIIVADVPCSGEGMFRKDEQAQQQWSVDNVALCQARQRRIVADVWPALASGGFLIYSTCTFNRLENDDNVAWVCSTLGGFLVWPGADGSLVRPGADEFDGSEFNGSGILKTDCGYALVPGLVPGEGQYCAAIRKADDKRPETARGSIGDGTSEETNVHGWETGPKARGGRAVAMRVRGDRVAPLGALGAQVRAFFDREVDLRMNDATLIAVPKTISTDVDAVASLVRTVRMGCTVGTVKGKELVPSADLALSQMLSGTAFPRVEVGRETALSFLHRDSLRLADAPDGYLMLTYMGLPLGFVKNLGQRCNNLHPQSRRIRKDVRPRGENVDCITQASQVCANPRILTISELAKLEYK